MKSIYTSLAVTVLFLFAASTSFSQNNNLAAGDFAIVSYSSDEDLSNAALGGSTDFDDRFSIVILRPGGIAAGTVVYFTDRGWDGPNGTWLDNGTVGHEAVIKWVVPAGGVAQGTEVYFISHLNTSTFFETWTASSDETGTPAFGVVTAETVAPGDGGGMGFTVSGDEVLAYQTGPTGGPAGAYNATPIRFITALLANNAATPPASTTYSGWDATPISLNESSLPPGLVNGQTAFLMSPGPLPAATSSTNEPDNGKYNCTGSTSACSASALCALIYTITNWTYNNGAFAIGATSSHCTYTINSPVTYSLQPSPSTSCAGLPVSFTVTASGGGTLTYQWQESADVGFTSPTTLSNTGVYSNTGTNTLTISDNTALNGKYYRAIVTGTCGAVNSNGALLTATTPTLSANNSVTQAVGTQNNTYYAASCAVIGKIVPSGASPVTGNVTTQVWVEGAVPTVGTKPFVQRHYEVTPATSPATATATVTLYFSQAEFNNFNAHANSTLDLPTGTADAAGKANLRIAKYSGSTNNGSGLPGSYTSSVIIIDPPDANIVFNAAFSRWEVTFDVVGFSGFIVQTSGTVLPVKLISFAVQKSNSDLRANWQTSEEINNKNFELERSTDGSNFTTVGQVSGNNGTRISNYSYTDAGAALLNVPKLFYRLKMVSQTGDFEYSNVIVVSLSKSAQLVTSITPNPFTDKLGLNLNMPADGQLVIKITDAAGRTLVSENAEVLKGYSTHFIPGVEKLAVGVYLLSINFKGEVSTYKLVK